MAERRAERDWILIDGARETALAAHAGAGSLQLPADALERASGWQLKSEGLCKDDLCFPVAERARLVREGGVDLVELARVAELPLALDVDERVAVLGDSAGARAAALQSGQAPDFELPDLDGKRHRLSNHRGKKVLLIAYASW